MTFARNSMAIYPVWLESLQTCSVGAVETLVPIYITPIILGGSTKSTLGIYVDVWIADHNTMYLRPICISAAPIWNHAQAPELS